MTNKPEFKAVREEDGGWLRNTLADLGLKLGSFLVGKSVRYGKLFTAEITAEELDEAAGICKCGNGGECCKKKSKKTK